MKLDLIRVSKRVIVKKTGIFIVKNKLYIFYVKTFNKKLMAEINYYNYMYVSNSKLNYFIKVKDLCLSVCSLRSC